MAPLSLSFTVACEPDHAFAVWTQRASAWWPADHSISGEQELEVVFEPHTGGRVFERTPGGEEHEWGQVLTWDPPRRLVYAWQLSTGAADPTEVEVTFTASGGRTAVTIEHRGWERFGADAERRKAANRIGWGAVIPCYERACSDVVNA